MSTKKRNSKSRRDEFLNLRLPSALKDALRIEADVFRISLSKHAVALIEYARRGKRSKPRSVG